MHDPLKRVRDPVGTISGEEPLLLCPAGPENPEEHIEFHDDEPRGLTPRGAKTIHVLGLNGHSKRSDYLADIRMIRDELLTLLQDRQPNREWMIARRRELLLKATKSDAPWSSMVRKFISKNPIP